MSAAAGRLPKTAESLSGETRQDKKPRVPGLSGHLLLEVGIRARARVLSDCCTVLWHVCLFTRRAAIDRLGDALAHLQGSA